MTYPLHTIAAAIATIAEDAIVEGDISTNDNDAMGKVMAEAEEMVANQLARGGMNLTEAREAASEAAVMPGRTSAESRALSQEAFRNRHAVVAAPIQASATAAENDVAQDDEASGDMRPATDGTASVGATTAEAGTTQPGAAAPQVPAAMRTHIVRELPPMRYEIVEKKVHEVFRGIQSTEVDFDFTVPVINWEGVHPKVPPMDHAYNMDVGHLLTVLYAVADGVSLNVVGPHGCGKTQLINQVAARLNFPVTTLPMDGQLTRREIIGQEKLRAVGLSNESYFAPGLLPRAMAEPGFILFDEVDRGVSDLQYACHSVFLGDGLTILEDGGRHIPSHRYNRVFGTANTKGRGSVDGMYQPPEEMSEATRDRWSIWLEMGYQSVEDDALVISKKVPNIRMATAEMVAGVAENIRNAYNEGKLSQTCSMRQQLDVARFAAFLTAREQDEERHGKLVRMAFDRIIGGRASPEDKIAIDDFLQIKLPSAFTGDPIY